MARHASGQDDGPPSYADDGQPMTTTTTTAGRSAQTRAPANSQHRLSVEEDYLYQEVINHTACKLSQDKSKHQSHPSLGPQPQEPPPPYACSVHSEAVFMMKLEVENATKRAEDRRWRQVYAMLHGTTLNIHHPKKGWGWGKKSDIGRSEGDVWDSGRPPGPSDDRPLGVKAGKLIKSYGLLHADVGIASDYRKRRYVLRVRADADQFLISCLELETCIWWLDDLFAAIDIAMPLEDRDFPRDQSIPRVQRLRWLRGEGPLRPSPPSGEHRPHPSSGYSQNTTGTAGALARAAGAERRGPVINVNGELVEPRSSRDSRASTVVNFDEGGKWKPRHAWTRRHDLLYAKLCYSTLLFRSPRKSNFVIMKGDQWYVDWPTGRMARVRPPEYSDVEVGGPFFEARVGNTKL
ncbi:ph domain-containing protein [Zalerion maritima]|uniref:Ph domain-containing protein n=1 Tax=Zalerion maritima TaxID=339359 RepID=A0AAD5RN44_9PEZI|nr:ph domain-containing protein [Zalerion maritima]